VVPFVGEIIPDVNVSPETKVVCFGAYSMRKLGVKKNWYPGVYDIEWFTYQSLISALGQDVLNHDAIFGKFGDISPPSDLVFIRPTHDGKEFAGTVQSSDQFVVWRQRVVDLGLADNGSTLTADTEVMMAPVKKIYNERRNFVVGGKVITNSQYKIGRRVVYGETDQYMKVAQSFVDRLNPFIDQPYVIDVAETDDGPKVIELNTLNCAGFYACDVQKLIAAIIDHEEGSVYHDNPR